PSVDERHGLSRRIAASGLLDRLDEDLSQVEDELLRIRACAPRRREARVVVMGARGAREDQGGRACIHVLHELNWRERGLASARAPATATDIDGIGGGPPKAEDLDRSPAVEHQLPRYLPAGRGRAARRGRLCRLRSKRAAEPDRSN